MVIKGNDILILNAAGQALGAAVSGEIKVDADTEEISSAATGSWREYIVTRKKWQMSLKYIVTDKNHYQNLLMVGETYRLTWKQRATEGTESLENMNGTAICTACSVSARRGNVAQGSFTFKGTGELKYDNGEEVAAEETPAE